MIEFRAFVTAMAFVAQAQSVDPKSALDCSPKAWANADHSSKAVFPEGFSNNLGGGAGRKPSSSRSKLMSELVGDTWWISTARRLVPSKSKPGLTLVAKKVDSSAPETVEEARSLKAMGPFGMLLRNTSLPFR